MPLREGRSFFFLGLILSSHHLHEIFSQNRSNYVFSVSFHATLGDGASYVLYID